MNILKKRGFVQDIRDVKRLEQIVIALVKYELGFIVEKLKLKKHLPVHKQFTHSHFQERDTHPKKIVKLFEELGGTFVKLGQLLSVRPDLLPTAFCDAFRELQDNVPEFSGEEAVRIIELELKKPIRALFSHFEKKPIAAASIGQVHKATLKNGRKVVVKVQRPGIRKLIDTDIDILFHLAQLIAHHYHPKLFDPVAIIREFERYTHDELDYNAEARNIERFHQNFQHDKITKIPSVHWSHTSERVLTMDFIHGYKISEVKDKLSKARKKLVAKRVVNAVYKQVFVDGFFHADPHPGNIFVRENDYIAFLDFGIVGRFDEELKDKVVNLFVAMISADVDSMAKAMTDLGVIGQNINTEFLERDLTATLGQYYGSSLEKVNLSTLFNQMLEVAKKNNMTMPTDLVLLGKSIVTVEGFAVELDPKFNLVKFSKPFVKKLARRKLKPDYLAKRVLKTTMSLKDFISRFPKQTNELLARIREGDKSIKAIDEDVRVLTVEIDRSSNRVAIGLMITAFIIASALLFTVEIQQYGFPILATIGFGIAFLLMIALLVSVGREKRY